MLNSLSGQSLHNNCIPLIVPRFSFFTEDFFVVGNGDITELGRDGYVTLVICVGKLPL